MVTRDMIIFKNIFLAVCVSLSGLGPSETHEKLSMRKNVGFKQRKTRRKVVPSLTPFGAARAAVKLTG